MSAVDGIGPGARVGAYEVLELVGEGASATVYAARQASPRRLVALKLMRSAEPTAGGRFEREVAALGNLQHPGIAQIYEAGRARVTVRGEARDVTFLAMELVRGRTLVEHARHAGLGLAERLELLARVCDAVHHAHQRGVVHRDLKPANVLVQGEETAVGSSDPEGWPVGRPKVLDFGIARIARPGTPASETRTGELVGTLAYASPEQLEGRSDEVGAASDVHALGTLLYELVAGSLPHPTEGLSLAELVERRRDEPPSLAALDPSVPRDVAVVAARALARDPARRYPSAAELARDLRRHLCGEPIQARSDSTLYRLQRRVRRHRLLAATALVALLLLLLLGPWLGRERRREDRLAAWSEQDFARALDALDLVVDAGGETLDHRPEAVGAQRELLERAQRFYAELALPGDDPASRLRMADALARLGRIRWHLGVEEEAFETLRDALAALDRLADEGVDTRAARRLPLYWIGEARVRRGELDLAEDAFRESAAISAADRERRPDDPAIAIAHGRTLWALGSLQGRRGDGAQAAQTLAAAREVLEAARRIDPTRDAALDGLVRLELDLAGLHLAAGRLAEARDRAQAARTLAEELLAGDPPRLDHLAHAQVVLGVACFRAGERDAAERAWRAAVEIGERLVADDPGHPLNRERLFGACANLGALYGKAGRLDEAERCLTRAGALMEELAATEEGLPIHRGSLGWLYVNLGSLYVDRGEYARAGEVLERSIEETRAGLAAFPEHGDWEDNLEGARVELARAELGRGRHLDAVAIARELTPRRDGIGISRLLRVVARAIELARADEGLAPADADELVGVYVRDAIELVERCVARGHSPRHLGSSFGLEPLLAEPDFDAWLALAGGAFDLDADVEGPP